MVVGQLEHHLLRMFLLKSETCCMQKCADCYPKACYSFDPLFSLSESKREDKISASK